MNRNSNIKRKTISKWLAWCPTAWRARPQLLTRRGRACPALRPISSPGRRTPVRSRNDIFVKSFVPDTAPDLNPAPPNPPKKPGQVKKTSMAAAILFVKGQYPVLWIGIVFMPIRIRIRIPMLMPNQIQIQIRISISIKTMPILMRVGKQNIFFYSLSQFTIFYLSHQCLISAFLTKYWNFLEKVKLINFFICLDLIPIRPDSQHWQYLW